MSDFLKVFKDKNVASLSLAFVTGLAAWQLLSDFVAGIVLPLVASIFDLASLAQKTSDVGEARLYWGTVVNSAITFLVVAVVVYYVARALGYIKSKK